MKDEMNDKKSYGNQSVDIPFQGMSNEDGF